MPVKPLPPNPNLDHLKYQAKDLLREHSARTLAAAQRIREFHPRFSAASDAEIFGAHLRLSDAQLTIAREAGFPGWSRLKAHVEMSTPAERIQLPYHERIQDPIFRRGVELLDAGDEAGLRSHLKEHPTLTRERVMFEGGNYFRNPTLLEFIADNPVRHGTLPENIAQIAQVILDAGVEKSALNEALALVSTGRVLRECGVQAPLITLLCDCGADASAATHSAAVHGELEALRSLLDHGARLDLPIATALGRVEDTRRLLSEATAEDRHLALALAAQFGHREIVGLLLDAGEDPNRYNPVGSHSHATPLHQAALAGHHETVRLLVERGARLDLQDLLWQGTPADWARHQGHAEIETYLRAKMAKENETAEWR